MKRPVKSATLPLILCFSMLAMAQGPVASTAATTPKRGADIAKSTQPVDKEYTNSIIKNTTDTIFLTELADHLPMSSTVPSPDKILGYPIGTPNRLTYTKDQYRYYRELARTSPRVRVFVASELSEQGREQLLIVISDEANLTKLVRYKEITAKLGGRRGGKDHRSDRYDRSRLG